jgi:hypothetical protein
MTNASPTPEICASKWLMSFSALLQTAQQKIPFSMSDRTLISSSANSAPSFFFNLL